MTQTTVIAADPAHRKSAVPEKKKRTGLAIFFLAAAVLCIGVAASGVFSRTAATAELQQRADKAAGLVVRVVHPEKYSGMIQLQLPAQTMPYTDAPIFPQTSGYVKAWYFDIGAKVQTGQVEAIRARMQHNFPDVGVWFPPPDIATQILNFGLPAPI